MVDDLRGQFRRRAELLARRHEDIARELSDVAVPDDKGLPDEEALCRRWEETLAQLDRLAADEERLLQGMREVNDGDHSKGR